METFRKHRLAVWVLAITLSVLTFTLGHILAEYSSKYSRYWYPEYLIISLILIVILLGAAYFITRQSMK